MGRTAVEAEEMHVDDIDKVCFSLSLDEEKCSLIREAVESVCAERGPRKRGVSDYNRFIGSCVKQGTGPVTERFKGCVERWKKGER